ncbi:MAG: alcohol dehydrogenase [Gammaproteobacteria bacterium]|nr:MAG: alcohol dehydrogenase [Gammaproteobacteria bacterium]
MKAATTQGFGFNSVLVVEDVDPPKVGAKEVVVEVYGSSVNPKDWKLNQNLSAFTPRLGGLIKPFLMGDDLAGVVVEIGVQVTDFEVGDKVYGMNMGLRTAACAEYAVISQDHIARMPKSLSYIEAGSVPLAGLTALQGLRVGKIKPESKVLIIGASGGVGTFAVQIAKALGAEVTGVCSDRNVALVKGLGADEVIDYTSRDYLAEENDFDLVFDTTSYYSLSTCSSLLGEQGIYVTTVGYGKAYLKLFKDNFFSAKQKAKFILVNSNTKDLDALREYSENGQLKPVLDGEYAIEEIHQAYARSKTGRAVGKIAVRVREVGEEVLAS